MPMDDRGECIRYLIEVVMKPVLPPFAIRLALCNLPVFPGCQIEFCLPVFSGCHLIQSARLIVLVAGHGFEP